MGNGRGEAEQPRTGCAEVDRVVVPADLGITPADIAVGVPAGRLWQRLRFVLGRLTCLAFQLQPAHQHAAGLAPEQADAVFGFGDQVEGAALGMRLQIACMHRKAQPFDTAQWAQHLDAVVQVHQAEQREGEVWRGHQLQLQRERHDMWISTRQAAIVGEVAQPTISGQVARLDADEAAQAVVRQLVAADAALAGRA